MARRRFGAQEAVVALAVLVAVIGGIYFLASGRSTRVTVTNDGASFSFDTDTAAKAVKADLGGRQLEYFDTTPVGAAGPIAVTFYQPRASKTTGDVVCPPQNETFKVTILGRSHVVCGQNKIIYIANVQRDGKWYQLTVFAKDRKTPIQRSIVTQVLESTRL